MQLVSSLLPNTPRNLKNVPFISTNAALFARLLFQLNDSDHAMDHDDGLEPFPDTVVGST